MAALLALAAACNRPTAAPGTPDDTAAAPAFSMKDGLDAPASTLEPRDYTPAPRPAKSEARPATPKPKAKPAAPKEPAETIYVESEGAQCRVWGHITMRGDRGTGTIHDWDENTLTVTVTRHGNELFAVDQNSRRYVFKLKQNKTQQ